MPYHAVLCWAETPGQKRRKMGGVCRPVGEELGKGTGTGNESKNENERHHQHHHAIATTIAVAVPERTP